MKMQSKLIITSVVLASLGVTAMARPAQRGGWGVPGTRPASIPSLQYSEDPVIPCRVVSLRDKYSTFSDWGALTIYPVVRAPNGQVFRGFVRHYPAGKLADGWIRWTFPTQFRSKETHVEDEASAGYGDVLTDDYEAGKTPPFGQYEVKWVVNGKLLEIGDSFKYARLK